MVYHLSSLSVGLLFLTQATKLKVSTGVSQGHEAAGGYDSLCFSSFLVSGFCICLEIFISLQVRCFVDSCPRKHFASKKLWFSTRLDTESFVLNPGLRVLNPLPMAK